MASTPRSSLRLSSSASQRQKSIAGITVRRPTILSRKQLAAPAEKKGKGDEPEQLWSSPEHERHDILLFNDVFHPVRPRAAMAGQEGTISERKDSLAAQLAEAWGSEGQMPPRYPGSCVGREKFLRRLGKLMFERGERQIKLYGAEGSGKTAVASEFVHTFERERFPGGVIWLNGSTIVWDVSNFLVEEMGLHAYANTVEIEVLRQCLWKVLYDNPKPWLLVIDDASDEGLEWMPPLSMMNAGYALCTSKSKSGRDDSLRVELPLLSVKSLTDLVLRFSKQSLQHKDLQTQRVLAEWTDSFHLCRNLVGIKILGFLCTSYNLPLADLLQLYNTTMEKTVMPDLVGILDRYKLRHHASSLKNIGVLGTMDFVRGRPWTSLEGLSRKEVYLFEKIQENLHRSRNRLGTKLLCKLWRDLVVEEPERSAVGRDLWELLRVCSFYNARCIPIGLVSSELGNLDLNPASDAQDYGDLLFFSRDALCLHSSLLDAVRTIHQKPSTKNRLTAKRVLTVLHAYCVENLFPQDQSTLELSESNDREFRTLIKSMLPHIFFAVGLCSDLLLKNSALNSASSSSSSPKSSRLSTTSLRTASSIDSVRKSIRGNRNSMRESSSNSLASADSFAEDRERSEELSHKTNQSSNRSSTSDFEDLDNEERSQGRQSLRKSSTRRHSLFSVNSNGTAPSGSASQSASTHASGSPSLGVDKDPRVRRKSALVAATGPMLKQISRRLSVRSRKSSPKLLLADLNVIQGEMLLLVQLGDFRIAEAEVLFTKALKVYITLDDKTSIRATKGLLAYCKQKRGLHMDSFKLWHDVLDDAHSATQKAFVQSSFGIAYASTNQVEQAETQLMEAIELDASGLVGARTLLALGTTQYFKGELNMSVESIRAAIVIYTAVSPVSFMNAEAHKVLSHVLAKAGDVEGALAHVDEAISIYSDAAADHCNIQLSEVHSKEGKIYQGDGQYDNAIDAYVRSLDHADKLFGSMVDNPDSLHVLEDLAVCSQKLGRRATFEDWSKRAKEMKRRLNTWASLNSNDR
eukprot:CAMPEP_0184519218 /NCGR_PEP_ID=MMETSP0198_2-20121128/6509_1 /TAXON_ID=1112570 /ORGANISM="Thraustochytrium sp., Strain LLF1b" /LENGTH=1030 /DNA_ID=CAMNT_0026909719 /DNA_START=590 /DNA_END=3682 /DNA_ORIENTATION=+